VRCTSTRKSSELDFLARLLDTAAGSCCPLCWLPAACQPASRRLLPAGCLPTYAATIWLAAYGSEMPRPHEAVPPTPSHHRRAAILGPAHQTTMTLATRGNAPSHASNNKDTQQPDQQSMLFPWLQTCTMKLSLFILLAALSLLVVLAGGSSVPGGLVAALVLAAVLIAAKNRFDEKSSHPTLRSGAHRIPSNDYGEKDSSEQHLDTIQESDDTRQWWQRKREQREQQAVAERRREADEPEHYRRQKDEQRSTAERQREAADVEQQCVDERRLAEEQATARASRSHWPDRRPNAPVSPSRGAERTPVKISPQSTSRPVPPATNARVQAWQMIARALARQWWQRKREQREQQAVAERRREADEPEHYRRQKDEQRSTAERQREAADVEQQCVDERRLAEEQATARASRSHWPDRRPNAPVSPSRGAERTPVKISPQSTSRPVPPATNARVQAWQMIARALARNPQYEDFDFAAAAEWLCCANEQDGTIFWHNHR
jgi:hypothetical protein